MKPSEIEYHLGSVSGKFRLLGFATGSYSCTCSICEKEFIGDKRAYMCLECAIERAEKLQMEWVKDNRLDWLEENNER